MPIQVLLDTITSQQMTDILDYYNKNKLPNEQPLEKLDRIEGGFKINIDYMINELCDDNKKIKQLRWNDGFLLSQYYKSFTKTEEKLLYDALVSVLGNAYVVIKEY